MKVKLYNKYDNDIPMLNRVLINRGIPKEQLVHYLNTTDEDISHPAYLGSEHMKLAAKALLQCVNDNKRCYIIVDSDCDGYTSSAILINYLYKLFPSWTVNNVNWFIHSGKQHGLSDCIEKALQYDLVICPDSASNDYEYHKRLKDANIPCIVLDHHEADKVSEDAIIINNQMCDYKNKDLSGAGVTWQFCRFIDILNETNFADDLIDLCALGNCGDMMSMLSIETKHLINKGFKEENLKNPFIYNMRQKNAFKLGDKVTPMGAAFYIVPFVNAMVRSGTQEEKEILFKAMLTHTAFEKTDEIKYNKPTGNKITIAERAVSVCEAVKRRQTKIETDSMAYFEKKIKEDNMMNHKVLLFLLEPGEVDRNIAGLIANKLMAKYQRPCCILTKVTEEIPEQEIDFFDSQIETEVFDPTMDIAHGGWRIEKGAWIKKIIPKSTKISYQGSARGCDKVGITEFKDICAATGATMYTAGHQGAFGLGIMFQYPDDDYGEVAGEDIINFIEKTDEILKDMSDEPVYYVDHIFYGGDVDPDSILEIARWPELWGSRMDEPYIMIEDLSVTSNMVDIYKKKTNTIKITLPNRLAIIKFNATEDECDIFGGDGVTRINLVGQCRANEWNGRITPQIELKDYDVITQSKFYF